MERDETTDEIVGLYHEEEFLEGLRSDLHDRLREGTVCPVCDQHAQEYRRKLNAGMAHALIVMFHTCGLAWFHKPTVLRGVGAAARDESLLRFWGLIEEQPKSSDGGRSGWWRVTPKGQAFVEGRLNVPKYAVIYNGACNGLEGELVDIVECVGSRFKLHELMNAA